MGSDPTGAFGAIRKRPWVSLLVLLILLSTALLLVLRARIGFFLDDWALIISREGPTDWLLPYNEHIIVIPSALYDLSLSLFGITAMPIHLLGVLLFELSVFLLFLWLRPLTGEPASLLGCAVVLFLGASAADLIWAFQIGYFGSVAAGLGALLLLRRNRGRDDLLACLLLVVSLLFSSMAVPFAIAAAVQLLYRDPGRPEIATLIRRAWVFVIPALCFIIWWLGWGQHADSSISLGNLLRVPVYMLSALGYATASLTGLFPAREVTTSYLWALPGLAVAAGLVTVLNRRRRIPPEFLIAAAAGLSFWFLCALNYIPGRDFDSSRYQYPGVVFLLMMLAGAFTGFRPNRRQWRYLKAVAAFSVAVNIAALFFAFNNTYKVSEERNLASLTALDISGPGTIPTYSVNIGSDNVFAMKAADYFRIVDRYGSPAWSEQEIDDQPEAARERIDKTLNGALPILLLPANRVTPDRQRCHKVTADPEGSVMTEVDTEYLLIRSRQLVLTRLERFGPGMTSWAVPAGRAVGFRIPEDNSERPWQIGFEGEGEVTLCPATRRETGPRSGRPRGEGTRP